MAVHEVLAPKVQAKCGTYCIGYCIVIAKAYQRPYTAMDRNSHRSRIPVGKSANHLHKAARQRHMLHSVHSSKSDVLPPEQNSTTGSMPARCVQLGTTVNRVCLSNARTRIAQKGMSGMPPPHISAA